MIEREMLGAKSTSCAKSSGQMLSLWFQVHARLGQGQDCNAIAIRTTMWAGLSKELISGVSNLGTAEQRGPRAQAKAYPRSEAHEGRVPQTRSALLARIKEIKQTQAKSKSKLLTDHESGLLRTYAVACARDSAQ
jgi:hypothetical protein